MRIENLSEYVDFLSQHRPTPQHAVGLEPWYRGQADSDWPLLPGVFRKGYIERVGTNEITLNNQFRRFGAAMLPTGASLCDIYFLAQHHGLPTRLLDWTTNGLAALFFAVSNHPETDGALCIFAPSCCTFSGFGIDDGLDSTGRAVGPFDMRHPLVEKGIRKVFGDTVAERLPPLVPVVPDLRYGRLVQQQARFTLHLDDEGKIPDPLCCVHSVPRERKQELMSGLRALGITWATLFPDLDYLTRELRSDWGM